GYLSEAMTQEITNALARLPGLRVAARSSVLQVKERAAGVRETARQLGVVHLLEGSAHQTGDRVRITAQLVSAQDGYYRWSQSYDRAASELLTIPADIALAVGGNLGLRMVSGDGAALLKRRTQSAEAYNLVLKARYLRPGGEASDERTACYRQALEYDPGYADAYIGLADEWTRLAIQGSVAPREVMDKARDATQKALQLNDGLPDAHFVAAVVKWTYDWDWPGAERE